MWRFLFWVVLTQICCVQTLNARCVQIYYDSGSSTDPSYTFGRVHALFLQNLLGHFPTLQQFVTPVEKYEKGQIERCETNFYVGTYYNNPLPNDFLSDFVSTTRQTVWLGYNVWEFTPDVLLKLWGASYQSLSTLDWQHVDTKGLPGFFRDFDYKGQTFTKYGVLLDGQPTQFDGAYEMTLLKFLDPESERTVLSWARHSTSGQRAPYVIKNGSHWFVADSPFSFIHEADRYLIFSDLLFDMLGEPPIYLKKKPALIRIEDVHPRTPLSQLNALANAFQKMKANFAISLIPVFNDPYRVQTPAPLPTTVDLTQVPAFVDALRQAQAKGGVLLQHGVTHQLDNVKNPVGVTAADFEFWDKAKWGPVDKDSSNWVVERLERSFSVLDKVGLKVAAWLTPHYAASPLDNIIFGQMFLWTMGRSFYVPHTIVQKSALPSLLSSDLSGSSVNGQRLRYFEDLVVSPLKGALTASQFFPYEIYGDAYGQRLIPENVGYLNPDSGITVDTLIERIQRNAVLRDTWASLFIHPFMVEDKAHGGLGEFSGDTREIERLIAAIQNAGYEFVDLGTWTQSHLKKIRPQPIEP